ncbi:hypothetical protein AALA83_06395 [Oscillospiraceae bacterium 44-5]
MNPIIRPNRAISFEDALRNLASRLTGRPAADLPRTQEAIVQYMAENVPTPSTGGVNVDGLAEAVTKEVLARITESMGANPAAKEPAEAVQDGVDAAGGTSTPPAAETPQDGSQTPAKAAPKSGSGRKSTKAKA